MAECRLIPSETGMLRLEQASKAMTFLFWTFL